MYNDTTNAQMLDIHKVFLNLHQYFGGHEFTKLLEQPDSTGWIRSSLSLE
jgi:hypothetical protein